MLAQQAIQYVLGTNYMDLFISEVLITTEMGAKLGDLGVIGVAGPDFTYRFHVAR